ncbi:MAG TPA: glycosyltransferase family 4 protein [Verrucomicrobiae bacterium]|nr:glycosyltransferase family 4 protein [Verrucomicrobiae bacterium]
MKIVLISDWFAEAMGYSENCLPKALASLGPEVHLLTANVQPYFNSPSYRETYKPFLGPGIVDCVVKKLDGYTLHRLPHATWCGGVHIRGLSSELLDLRPDVVQTFAAGGWTTYHAARAQRRLGYKFFTEQHCHASVYPGVNLRARLHGTWQRLIVSPTMGRWVSSVTQKCYPISPDAAEIAIRYFGLPKQKLSITPLGVDTDLFQPIADDSARRRRDQLRSTLGFKASDIVCVYAGRFSSPKDPLCLAQAVAALATEGHPFRGLFVGGGKPEEVRAIQDCAGCVIHPFVSFRELVAYYQAADIGVWPRQESTSQLDAAACGLPIIISDRVTATERVAGNGLVYREGDRTDLRRVLLSLADGEERQQLGMNGAMKMRQQFSWRLIAEHRLADYEVALRDG